MDGKVAHELLLGFVGPQQAVRALSDDLDGCGSPFGDPGHSPASGQQVSGVSSVVLEVSLSEDKQG